MTEQDPSESSTQTAGEQLAQKRKERNLSVADVAAKLRIAPRQIEAMEADDFDRLPGHTIARGFVRNYARFLLLDPESVLEAFEKQTTNKVASRITLRDQNVQFSESGIGHRNRPMLRLTLGLLILTGLAYAAWRWEGNFGPSAKQATPAITANSPTPNLAVQSLPVVTSSAPIAPLTPEALGVAVPESATLAPSNIAERLQNEISKLLKQPDVKERFLGIGVEPGGNSSAAFGEFLRSEMARWAKVVKDAGIQTARQAPQSHA